MKKYRINSIVAGALYFMGTAFGVLSAVSGGKVLSSIVANKPFTGDDLLGSVAATSSQLTGGSFLILLMGISLVAMTVFLYPIFRKDSEELALGMLLFRGALEGSWYLITTLNVLLLITLGNEYVASGANSSELQSLGRVLYQFQDILGLVGSFMFLIGASCLYASLYRTRLIPRWLTVWGFIGVVPYMAYVVLHFFHIDRGMGFYLQMVLAPQELVMGLWLVIKGFNQAELDKLMTNT